LYSNPTIQNKVINLYFNSFESQINEFPDAVLLDVRTKLEFNQARIPYSILIDFYSSDFEKQINKLDRKKKYLIYCRSGNRSYYAVSKMLEMGFEDVAHLASGIIGWQGKVEYENMRV